MAIASPFHRLKSARIHPLSLRVVLGLTTILSLLWAVWQEFPKVGRVLLSWLEQNQNSSWLGISHLPPWYIWSLPLVLMGLAWLITRYFIQPKQWSRGLMVAILLSLWVRYVLWRVLATLNLDSPLAAVVSVVFLGLELLVLAAQAWQLNWMLLIKDRQPQAQRAELHVQAREYYPSVDILIPTYDEPLHILKRTIIGCQALDYDHVQIYLLDDTRRPEVKELAATLECHYLTRPNNLYAKAGNLNHGLDYCTGELVVVFDADFVPTRNFLTRTVGFFADPTVGLVQTYQSFYNHDPVSRNLGLTAAIPQEVEIFSRHYQILRDAVESAICYGSAFVVRRRALVAVGGFDVETLSEDYLTGVRLSSWGYQVLYLGESLSAGLCADDLAGHIQQRLRWCRGSLQSFFAAANPMTIPGLNRQQRIAHLEGLLQWFHSPIRLIFLLLPLLANGLGMSPIHATLPAWLYYSLPYYWVTLVSFTWLNGRSRSVLMSDVYSVLQCVPITLTVFHTLLFPFGSGFQVTPKGQWRWRYRLNYQIAIPLLLLWLASWANLLLMGLGEWGTPSADPSWGWIGLAWSCYNIVVLSLALAACVDVPRVDGFDWLTLKQPLPIDVKLGKTWQARGTVTMLSEGGAVLWLDDSDSDTLLPGTMLDLNLRNSLHLQAQAMTLNHHTQGLELKVMFSELTLGQYRQLVQFLFCQPGQWCWPQSPGELKTLASLLSVLIRPAWKRYPHGLIAPVTIDLTPGQSPRPLPLLEMGQPT